MVVYFCLHDLCTYSTTSGEKFSGSKNTQYKHNRMSCFHPCCKDKEENEMCEKGKQVEKSKAGWDHTVPKNVVKRTTDAKYSCNHINCKFSKDKKSDVQSHQLKKHKCKEECDLCIRFIRKYDKSSGEEQYEVSFKDVGYTVTGKRLLNFSDTNSPPLKFRKIDHDDIIVDKVIVGITNQGELVIENLSEQIFKFFSGNM